MEFIDVEKRDNLCRITLKNEKKLNAVNSGLIQELVFAFEKIQNSDDIYCVILKGEGSKAFICGSDIGLIRQMNREEAIDFSKKGSSLLKMIKNCNVPVIAEIKGYCLGNGMEIAAACDLRIAADNAKFAHPEAGLGLVTAFCGEVYEKELMGGAKLREMLYTGSALDAKDALYFGFVNKVVPISEIDDMVIKMAVKISENSPIAVKKFKTITNDFDKIDDRKINEKADMFADMLETEDTKMALEAFVNNKKPEKFNNR